MTGYGNGADRTERLRAGFQQQAAAARAEEAARDERRTHRAHTVIGAIMATLSVAVIVYRLGRGDHPGVWTACCAVGAALSASTGLLSRRVSPRLALVVGCLGVALAGVSDALSHPPGH
ncbi:hypothetical protein ACWC2K_09860 [Streptomyces chattanoogensis]|uniref:hypothetical protein n=1 Tax=Streptomyces chattanoogensis TaxID=66876 RepID=UPI00368F321F